MMKSFFLSFALALSIHTSAQLQSQAKSYTLQDTLRGSLGADRTWWDVQHYTVYVDPDFNSKTIAGKVDIEFKVTGKGDLMQIDLQQPMQLNKAYLGDQELSYSRVGNVFFVKIHKPLVIDSTYTIALSYSGNVQVAVRPPWDGGWIFAKDKMGRPWMSVACQGLGASVWFPCKDHQGDEPDKGATLKINADDDLVAVGNGRLKSKKKFEQGKTTWEWEVKNPINNYNIIPYIGKYVSFEETYAGEKGTLDCNYWVLDYNLDKAKKQFQQVSPMLKAFEHWFGAYPFYEDGFKLVESPHLGMEHQSAVAYGNGYQNGYRGRDLSGSGWGLKWDFIIIHESGHEWFGNNITTNEVADMWVHEGFTNYSETIFTTFHYGKEAGDAYVQGTRKLIENQSPVIGRYGVNEEGSGDMYYKGGNLVHYVRQLFDDDEKFRLSLREMNKRFYHKITTSAEVEKFWSEKVGRDLSPLFNQYLRETQVPTLEISRKGNTIKYRWADCLADFNAPVRIFANEQALWIYPTTSWKEEKLKKKTDSISIDKNFYVGFQELF